MACALNYYQGAKYHVETIRNIYKSFMNTMIQTKSGSLNVMDIGCGSGRIFYEALLPLLPKNVSKIIASDIDENMIDFCRSMNTDTRVSFEKLDITDEEMPKHLESRIDLMFSSYCFSYVKNWRQGLINCSRLLKPNGEVCFVSQYKTNPLYTTYRRMSAMDKWKSYTCDYKNYVTPLSSEDPELELKQLIKNIDLSLISYNFNPEQCYTMLKRDVLDAYLALEKKVLIVPEDQQEDFRKDLIRIFSEETDMDFVDEKSLDKYIDVNFPTVQAFMRRI